MDLKKVIRSFNDFPKEGVLFRDISPIMKDPKAFRYTIKQLCELIENTRFDSIAGIESRGFIFGSIIAYMMNKPFLPVRKEGKLPGETVKKGCSIEYGTVVVEMQSDALGKGQRVLIIDDLLATGGTAKAAAHLVECLGGIVAGFAFVIELDGLKGRNQLRGYPVYSLVVYE